MIRKTLTILSLIGLLLSVGLWGVSYFNVSVSEDIQYMLTKGSASFSRPRAEHLDGPHWGMQAWDGIRPTRWAPSLRFSPPPQFWWVWQVEVPLWIPAFIFGLLFASCRPLAYHRLRKRKKLGLCVKCGYDLRASKDRCPECGTGFS